MACSKPPAPAISAGCLLPEARAALEYLLERGLPEDAIRDLGLGWAGEGRGALAAELVGGRDRAGLAGARPG